MAGPDFELTSPGLKSEYMYKPNVTGPGFINIYSTVPMFNAIVQSLL